MQLVRKNLHTHSVGMVPTVVNLLLKHKLGNVYQRQALFPLVCLKAKRNIKGAIDEFKRCFTVVILTSNHERSEFKWHQNYTNLTSCPRFNFTSSPGSGVWGEVQSTVHTRGGGEINKTGNISFTELRASTHTKKIDIFSNIATAYLWVCNIYFNNVCVFSRWQIRKLNPRVIQ